MIKKILLPSLLIASIGIGTSACKNNETSSTTHEDSVKMVMMQARLDSMELALAQRQGVNSDETTGGFTETGGHKAENRRTKKRFGEKTRRVPRAGKDFFARDMGNYPEGSNRLLTERDIQHLSTWGYKLMLNEIYARHGMSFTDEELQDHFNNQDWYRTGRKNVDQSLSAIEKQNIEFLKNHPK